MKKISLEKCLLTLLLAGFFSLKIQSQSLIQIGNTSVKVDTLRSGLDVPWEIVYHNGAIWTTERKGIVSRIDTATGTKKVLLKLNGIVHQQSESGLLGMALHPDFSNTPEVFLAYTYLNSGFIKERIVKYEYQNDSLVNPFILLNELPGNGTHNGCRLLFLPDSTLLASTGDVQNLSLPQDSSALNGKILRMKADGSVPANNPFPGSLVYSLGHRNVQGIAALPNSSIVLSEHGASTDDEIQLLLSGGNYGWPNVEGFCNSSSEINFCNSYQVVQPLKAYTPTIAPSDMIFYQNPDFPEWHNTLLTTILKNKELRAIRLNESFDAILSDVAYLNNRFGRLRDVAVGANKEIYLATNGASWANTDPNTHSIIRLRPQPSITGIENETIQAANLRLFPNPAFNKIQFSLEGIAAKNLHFEVLNMFGRSVYSRWTLDKSGVLTSDQIGGPGLYLLRIKDEKGVNRAASRFLMD